MVRLGAKLTEFGRFRVLRVPRRGAGALARTPLEKEIIQVEDRLTMYLMTYCLLPRPTGNNAHPNEGDLRLMFALKNGIQVNWVKLMMEEMLAAAQSHDSALLPYPMFVTQLIRYNSVEIAPSEEVVKYKTEAHCLMSGVLHSSGIYKYEPTNMWLWKDDIEVIKAARVKEEALRKVVEEEALRKATEDAQGVVHQGDDEADPIHTDNEQGPNWYSTPCASSVAFRSASSSTTFRSASSFTRAAFITSMSSFHNHMFVGSSL
ncbi:hypothetical protein RIF29_08509 [Crotalaria pallida]|uniref:Uncharacterized protein n=1 Tax=Crotalaria pallida TaxID=3830 RepID=A0AAN9FXE4_CROPI